MSPRDLGDLESTDHAAGIARVDATRGHGRERAEALDQGLEAVGREVGFEPGADGRIAGQRIGVEATTDGAEVQAGATRQDRDAILGGDRGQAPRERARRSRRR